MENNKEQKLSIPSAIIVAGFIIMMGILIAKGGNTNNVAIATEKTLSEQVGISKTAFTECIQGFDTDTLNKKIADSVSSATKGETGVGTPYTIVIGANGIRSKIVGADSYENAKKVIDEVSAGKVTTEYKGEVPPVEEGEHILGNPATAQITLIEYSDFECPFCAKFHPTLKKIVGEANGNIAWVYRPFPLTQIHQHALERVIASECVAKIKGNDAYWKYADLLFKIVAPVEAPADPQL